MEVKKLIKISQPHVLSILGLFLLNVFFFYPLVNGKKLKQEDINQFESITRFNQTNHDNSFIEKYTSIFNGTIDETLWTNNIFSGMPIYLVHNDDKGNVLNDLIPNKWTPIGRLFIFSILAYILFSYLSISPLLAFAGAFAMAFTTNNLILLESGHMTKLGALSYAPLVIMGIIAAYRGKILMGSTLFSVGFSLMLAMNHIQMTYYLFLGMFIFVIFKGIESFKNKTYQIFGKATVGLTLGLFIGLLSNLHIIWPVYELSKQTVRGESVIKNPEVVNKMANQAVNPDMPSIKVPDLADQGGDFNGLSYENAMLWSFGWKDVVSAYIPGFVGGSEKEFLPSSSKLAKINVIPDLRTNLYWGSLKSTNGPVYIGAIIFYLFVLGMFMKKDVLTKSMLGAILLTVLLSFGRYLGVFSELIFDYLPFYNKFRAPNSIWGVTTILINILAILSIYNFLFIEKSIENKLSALKNSLYVCGGFALFIALFGALFFDFYGNRDPEMVQLGYMQEELFDARKILQRMDAIRSLVLVSLTAGLLWLALNKKIKTNITIIVIVLLIIGDIWQIGKRYIARDKFVSNAVSLIEKKKDDILVNIDSSDSHSFNNKV
jgi:hypothetical protein